MKIFLLAIFLLVSTNAARAQQASEILASAGGKNFTVESLSPEGRKLYATRASSVADRRRDLLLTMIGETVLETEAKASGTTPDKLVSAAAAKAAAATPAELQIIYNENTAAFGGRTFADVRSELVAYVKQAREQQAVNDFVETLKAKYKFAAGKDVNAADLKPGDVLATIGGRAISAAEFGAKYRTALNDYEWNIYGELKADLEMSMLDALTAEEAKARGVESQSIYASEVTDKLRAFTDQEKFELETALRNRLFAKYGAKILLKQPERIVLPISVDDDPSLGPANAPVTIVMFGDFQCPACAAAHPILRRLIAEFAGKVRLVARDFPLTSIHENAFRAALAANAARTQGKFFEYADILYKNQSALDDASLKKYAAGLGLNQKQFELDFTDEKFAAEVRKDMADGAAYGVTWTPSIYINGVKLMRSGEADIRDAINAALVK